MMQKDEVNGREDEEEWVLEKKMTDFIEGLGVVRDQNERMEKMDPLNHTLDRREKSLTVSSRIIFSRIKRIHNLTS